MPRRDGTGPVGIGPRTGRGLGRYYDNNFNQPAKNSSNNESLLEEKRILEEKLKIVNEKLKNN